MEYREYLHVGNWELGTFYDFYFDGYWLHVNPIFEDETQECVRTSEKDVDVCYLADTFADVSKVHILEDVEEIVVEFEDGKMLYLNFELEVKRIV